MQWCRTAKRRNPIERMVEHSTNWIDKTHFVIHFRSYHSQFIGRALDKWFEPQVSLFIHSYDLFMQRDFDVPGVSISFKFVSSQNKRWTIWSVLSIPHEQKNNIYHHNLLASTVRSDSWKTWIGWFLIEKNGCVTAVETNLMDEHSWALCTAFLCFSNDQKLLIFIISVF